MDLKILSVVVPVYNEEESLEHSHQRLINILNHQNFKGVDKFELIYVNDGSKDNSTAIIRKLIKENPNMDISISTILFSRNFGHSNAVFAGLDSCKGDYIVIIDADLQDPPEIVPEMFLELKNGFDVIYGQRSTREGETFAKKMTAWLFYRFLNAIVGVDIPKDTGDFRIITREVCDALVTCREHNPFLRGLVAWLGFRQKAFAYNRQSRKFGVTKYPFSKMLKFASHAIISFSNLPLRISIYLGFSSLFVCVGLILWSLYVHFSGHPIPGWTSILVIFLFSQTIILFILGMIGLYVGQIHLSVQNRPKYIIKG